MTRHPEAALSTEARALASWPGISGQSKIRSRDIFSRDPKNFRRREPVANPCKFEQIFKSLTRPDFSPHEADHGSFRAQIRGGLPSAVNRSAPQRGQV